MRAGVHRECTHLASRSQRANASARSPLKHGNASPSVRKPRGCCPCSCLSFCSSSRRAFSERSRMVGLLLSLPRLPSPPISTNHNWQGAPSFAILRTGPPANAFVRWGGEGWDVSGHPATKPLLFLLSLRRAFPERSRVAGLWLSLPRLPSPPISTNRNCEGAPSFAILRRVGCKWSPRHGAFAFLAVISEESALSEVEGPERLIDCCCFCRCTFFYVFRPKIACQAPKPSNYARRNP